MAEKDGQPTTPGDSRKAFDIVGTSGSQIRTLVAQKVISASEVVDAHISAVIELNPAIGAITQLDIDGAMRAAAAIDWRIRNDEEVPLLAGWPITIKDSFDVQGLRTTVGSVVGARTAKRDAPVVLRMRQAGAIILGKTNVPPMLDDYTSSNDDYGITRNPWDLSRTPGGSSGGAAAAVSACMSVADVGSDLYGSIRLPASWCGIYGHRPTNHIISKRGHMPGPPGLQIEPSLSTVGPLARTATDLATLTRVMCGIDGLPSRGWRLTLPRPVRTRLEGTRVALWLDEEAAPIDSETRALLIDFASRLSHVGCVIVPLAAALRAPPDAIELLDRLKEIELAHTVGAPFGSDIVVSTAWAEWERQEKLSAIWSDQFSDVDIVVSPAGFSAAPLLPDLPVDERWVYSDAGRVRAMDFHTAWSKLTNIARGPATVIPVGIGKGSRLPIGAQLLGPYMGDLTTLWFASQLERAGVIATHDPTGIGHGLHAGIRDDVNLRSLEPFE